MDTKEAVKKAGKPFIIANPIYDTVFKRMMENKRIAKFFLSAILETQIDELTVLPQEFTYKRIIDTKVSEEDKKEKVQDKGRATEPQYYSIFRLDFIAVIRETGSDGKKGDSRKILIELQKSWDTEDVMRFRKYLGEQYIREDAIDGKGTILPITTIYILGNNLAGIDCPCLKVGRSYINMLNKTAIKAKSKFIELLTHESYVIQTGRITDIRYTTNLDKILSIFEQRYFISKTSDTRKEYPYQPDNEDIEMITDVLYEMGADPEKRKELEDEEEAIRTILNKINAVSLPLKEIIEEKDKTIEEKDKTIEEKDKTIEEKEKTIEEKEKTIEEKEKTIEEKEKTIEEKTKRIAELECMIKEKQIE
jgi:hypothetical protein